MIPRDKYMRIRSPAQLLVGVKLTPRQLNLACCAALGAASSCFDTFHDDDCLIDLTKKSDQPRRWMWVGPCWTTNPQGPLSLYIRRLDKTINASGSCPQDRHRYHMFLADLNRAVWYEDKALHRPVAAAVRSVIGDPYDAKPCPESADRHVMDIAAHIRETLEFDQMPFLGDALEDAGSIDDQLLSRLRDPGVTFRLGEWTLDSALGLPRSALLPPRTKKR